MKNVTQIILIAIIFILIAIIGIGVYFIITDKKESENKIGDLENKVETLAGKEENVIEQNTVIENTVSKNVVSENKVVENTVENTTVQGNSQNTIKPVNSLAASFSEKDLSIKSIKLGTAGQGVTAVLGDVTQGNANYYTDSATGNSCAELNYESIGLKVKIESNDNDPDGSVTYMWYTGNEIVTRGLKVGSTKEEVLSAFKSESILANTSSRILVGFSGDTATYSEKGRMCFKISNGKVSEIDISNYDM